MAGLDDQRQSMALELYCRKAERKREGGLESKKGESLKRARRGQAAPLIVGWAILLLPGNCGEEHTWLNSGNCGGGI